MLHSSPKKHGCSSALEQSRVVVPLVAVEISGEQNREWQRQLLHRGGGETAHGAILPKRSVAAAVRSRLRVTVLKTECASDVWSSRARVNAGKIGRTGHEIT